MLERARSVDPIVAELVAPLLALTLADDDLRSEKRNVIPALCEITVDCRLLPGQHPQGVEPMIRARCSAATSSTTSTPEAQGGTRSPLDTPLGVWWSPVSESEPGAHGIAMCCSCFRDSHCLRPAFGSVAYGFFPARVMPPEVSASLIHSADERVPVGDLELGVDWLRRAARTLGG